MFCNQRPSAVLYFLSVINLYAAVRKSNVRIIFDFKCASKAIGKVPVAASCAIAIKASSKSLNFARDFLQVKNVIL